MQDFLFKSPTKILFGRNASQKLKPILESLHVKRIVIVTDRILKKSLPVIAMTEKLREEGFETEIFSDTVADPPIEVVDQAAETLKKSKADLVLAVGGGSSIDTAKAMCMLATNEGSIREYLFGGSRTVTNRPIPLIAVPTTAGSGSEVTAASVITDNQRNCKLSVTHEYLMPLYAIVDPLMQKGMPALITASTGMDALTHAIEAYVSLHAAAVSDAYAETAIRLIGESLRTATFDPENLEARSSMAVASVMAATAFVNAGLGAVHGIAQAMGGIAHTPHGIANSLLLPYVMKTNLPGNIKKFAKIAELLGENIDGMAIRDAAELSVDTVRILGCDLRIPDKLTKLNTIQVPPVTKEMFPTIVSGTMEYRLLALNPVKIREEDVYAILNKAYE
ncbi:MAG: iron-containing alcohol dehydrogenase [Lachnospiraceae bacterium]